MRRRRLTRIMGERRYRRLFILSVEGSITEHQYFAIINSQRREIHVNCLRSNKNSAPLSVLKRIINYLKSNPIKSSDQAWLVVDKDKWTDEQLIQLHNWAQKSDRYGLALSNPMFEFWLLLHFEDGAGIANAADCLGRLKNYLPGFDKSIDSNQISETSVQEAVNRARRRDNPPCVDWPRTPGTTTVYRLVDAMDED